MSNRERVVEAVNHLITASNYAKLVNEITSIIETWDTHPMAYGGHLSCLNALIDVGLTDRAAFEKLIKLVEAKRKLLPDIKRVDYQRDHMAEKRARLAKAVELHELQKGKFPDAKARNKHSAGVQARWMEARDKFVSAKGQLSWADRNAARNEFWDGIDAQLEASLAAERARKAR